jgi:hypothetical protein
MDSAPTTARTDDSDREAKHLDTSALDGMRGLMVLHVVVARVLSSTRNDAWWAPAIPHLARALEPGTQGYLHEPPYSPAPGSETCGFQLVWQTDGSSPAVENPHHFWISRLEPMPAWQKQMG